MQRTKSGLTFVLDESMVDYIETRTVFVMETVQDADGVTEIIFKEQSI